MKTLRFELTMPNVGSWNGKDTGEQGEHYDFRRVSDDLAKKLNGKSFSYDFGDGWRAAVRVTVNRRCKNNGFRGYEWMVDQIIKYGEIKTVQERRLKYKIEQEFKSMLKSFFDKNGQDELIINECDPSSFLFSGFEAIYLEEHYFAFDFKKRKELNSFGEK